MARYFDADFLIEQLQPAKNSVWNKNDHSKSMSEMIEDFCTELKNAPTADVVPKSEVDDLKRYIILNEDIAIKCKQENGEQNEEYWKGKISAFRQILAYIDAELKKKYIGE